MIISEFIHVASNSIILFFFMANSPLYICTTSSLCILDVVFVILAVLSLHCCEQAFSSCGEQWLLSGCGVRASRCRGFSCCGAWTLRHAGFSSCSTWAQ